MCLHTDGVSPHTDGVSPHTLEVDGVSLMAAATVLSPGIGTTGGALEKLHLG